MKKDIIYVAFVTSLVIVLVTVVIGFVTGNSNWYRAGIGAWTVLFISLIVGAVRTLRGKG